MDWGLERALERLWGLEFEPATPMVSRLSRPKGFVVAERRIKASPRGSYAVYLVWKEGHTTLRVARELSRLLGGEARFLGLKDSNAVTYQYMFVRAARDPPPVVEGRGFKAWLVGYREKPPALGGHLWNNFRLDVEIVEGDPDGLCSAVRGLVVPGLYGPQRFGVDRPNTHLVGLLLKLAGYGMIAIEYRYRYPLQRRYSGGYEERALREVRAARDPLRALKGLPASIAVEALQSYIWNRMVSTVYRPRDPPLVYERETGALCPERRTAWASRLPSRRLYWSRGSWASLLRRILSEESLSPWILPARAPMRPVGVEPCRLACRVLEPARARLWVSLPRGLYATMVVRALSYVEWLGGPGGID
ncbi:MAG: tRNA pseudouridine(13) synthase TruD [Desulfurococcales archaeon]|nr:tRNA pseudouridine(13) synthase TruD [Desulfurococcales archaeon]